MQQYRKEFDIYMGIRDIPNEHERKLFDRAQKYIQKISWIPGIEMIAITNSLSMFATHKDSDIDLFIVTRPKMLWFVRFFVTVIFLFFGVWRHGEDIAENFCLSFWITTDAMNMKNIAIDNDIYLYYWIYFMKPIFARGGIYERFISENGWVKIDENQINKNTRYLYDVSIKRGREGANIASSNGFDTFSQKNTEKKGPLYYINEFIRFFWLPKTQRKYEKLGQPEGVIISDAILKFHDKDRRRTIRDKIFQKNFDK